MRDLSWFKNNKSNVIWDMLSSRLALKFNVYAKRVPIWYQDKEVNGVEGATKVILTENNFIPITDEIKKQLESSNPINMEII